MVDYTIGQLGRAAGVGVETVRYYERRGLLARPDRSDGRARRYGPDALRQVRFIRRAQALGFTLQEIAELLELRLHPETSCAEVRPRAEAKLHQIDQKVQDLQSMRRALSQLIDRCEDVAGEQTPTASCPIVDALEEDHAEPDP